MKPLFTAAVVRLIVPSKNIVMITDIFGTHMMTKILLKRIRVQNYCPIIAQNVTIRAKDSYVFSNIWTIMWMTKGLYMVGF